MWRDGESSTQSAIQVGGRRKKACDLGRRYGIPTIVHMCGKSCAALDMLGDAGVTAVEPLEGPPGGDVNLAEVRKRYPQLVLKGNVNTFETLA